MARLALTLLIAVLTTGQGFGWDMPQPLAEFIISTTSRTRQNAVIVRPKVLRITPEPLKPKVKAFFDWLLGVQPEPSEAPHNPRVGESGELLKSAPSAPVTRLPPPRPRMSVDQVETMLAKDIDAVLADFKLKHALDDIKGESKTVKGDHGMVKWFGTIQRTNGHTVFEPLDEISMKAEVGFEFSLNVTYKYHLRATIDRDGQTTTLLRHQQASFIATLERPYSSYECYIRDPWVNYPKVTGLVDVEVHAPAKFSMLGYHGGAISSTLFPQCHTDIEKGIKALVPPATAENMIKYFREMLGGKVC